MAIGVVVDRAISRGGGEKNCNYNPPGEKEKVVEVVYEQASQRTSELSSAATQYSSYADSAACTPKIEVKEDSMA